MPGVFADLDLSPNPIEQARQRLAGRYIDLTSSNPTSQGLRFPAEVLSAAAASYWGSRHYRPDAHGNPAARTAICAYYAQRQPAWHVAPEALFLTASTSEAYSLLFTLLADPGDNLLAPDVTYPLFEYLAAIRGVELRPYHLDESRGWQIDGRSLRAAADEHTRGVLIVAPHNPTGAVIHKPLAALDMLGLPVICDEVFAPFSYGCAAVPPLAALHPDLPVFTLNGISKLFALPDLKLGWIALNTPAQHAYAARLELLNDTFLGANSLIQHMLPDLFAHGQPFVAEMVERVRHNLDVGCARLRACPYVRIRPPDGGYYLFPHIATSLGEEALVLALLDHGVLVHPGFFYGEPTGCHLMISALTEPNRFAQGLELLIDGLDRIVAAHPESDPESA